MTLEVKWYDDERTIIVATIARTSTWAEYHQTIDWIVSEAKKVDHRVDIIFHDNVGMPKGNPLPHLKMGSAKIIEQPNIYHSIIAGSQGYAGFSRAIFGVLVKSFMKILKITPENASAEGRQLLFMRTLDDALAHIKKDRVHS